MLKCCLLFLVHESSVLLFIFYCTGNSIEQHSCVYLCILHVFFCVSVNIPVSFYFLFKMLMESSEVYVTFDFFFLKSKQANIFLKILFSSWFKNSSLSLNVLKKPNKKFRKSIFSKNNLSCTKRQRYKRTK